MQKRIWSFLAVLTILAMPLTAMAEAASTPDNPVFFSLLPPLFTIGLALATRSVIPALFLGVVLGSWGLHGLDIPGLWQGTLDSVAIHVTGAVANADHAAVMVFSFMIGGTVGIISRNGGMQGIVETLVKKADNRRHGQLATAGMGVAIFIDDYANTLVVGNTMRPVTDKPNNGKNDAGPQKQAGPPGEPITRWQCTKYECCRTRGHRVWQLSTHMVNVITRGSEGR